MSIDPKLITEALDTEVAKSAYKDMLSTPAKEASKFFTDVIKTARLVMFPFQLTGFLQTRLEARLQASIDKVPKEDRVAPPSSILVPIANHLSYMEDANILVDLYQNLLARAMDKTRSSEAHPGFIMVIQQISPDEAIILSEMVRFRSFKFVRRWDLSSDKKKILNSRIESNEFPVEKLIFDSNFNMYIAHLEKLDLICVINKEDKPLHEDSRGKKNQIGGITSYTMGFTEFGSMFVKACLPDDTSPIS